MSRFTEPVLTLIFQSFVRSSLRLIGHSQLTESVLLCDATLVDSSKGVQSTFCCYCIIIVQTYQVRRLSVGPDGVEPEPPTSEAPPVNRRKLPPRRVASRETTPSFAVPSGSGSVAQSESVKPPSSRASAEPESSTQRRRVSVVCNAMHCMNADMRILSLATYKAYNSEGSDPWS